MNNKGIAVSIILYSIVMVAVLIFMVIVSVKSTTYKTNKTVTSATKSELTCQDKLLAAQDELALLKAGKVTLAAAITAKGVATSSTDTLEKMSTNVSSIKTGKTVVDLGTGTSFNVSGYAGYNTFNSGNFIISVTYATGDGKYSGTGSNGVYFIAGGSSGIYPSISYNASTGVVTVNSTSSSGTSQVGCREGSTECGTAYGHVAITAKVYLVY